MLTYWSPVQTETTSDSKRNNRSLIPTNFGRHFHAMSARLRPKARLIRITKWVSQFQTFQRCYHLYIDILLEFYSAPTAEFGFTDWSIATVAVLKENYATIRAQGFSGDIEEKNAGMRSIAVLVFEINRAAALQLTSAIGGLLSRRSSRTLMLRAGGRSRSQCHVSVHVLIKQVTEFTRTPSIAGLGAERAQPHVVASLDFDPVIV